MENMAGNASCCHLGYQNSSQKPSEPTLSYEHTESFTKELVIRRDLRNWASPVNRAREGVPLVT